jgi:L-cystine uptake protein TcyP (sodium:dicarboxylate symporter family)
MPVLAFLVASIPQVNARKAIAGGALGTIAPLLVQMLIVGFVSILLGYAFFRSFEHLARKQDEWKRNNLNKETVKSSKRTLK